MGRTSKKHFDKDFSSKIWGDFFDNLKKAESGKSLKNVLKIGLTDEEIILLEKRLVVKKLLEEKISYSEISRKADITRATVRFIKDNFKRPVWKKRKYSESKNKTKSNWHDPLKPRIRKYRFIPKTKKHHY